MQVLAGAGTDKLNAQSPTWQAHIRRLRSEFAVVGAHSAERARHVDAPDRGRWIRSHEITRWQALDLSHSSGQQHFFR